MGTQISLKLSNRMIDKAKKYANHHGFDNLQDLIRETLRKKLFEKERRFINGLQTYKASEKALGKNWLLKEEDDAWKHLEKEI